jgi:hypothetical protein
MVVTSWSRGIVHGQFSVMPHFGWVDMQILDKENGRTYDVPMNTLRFVWDEAKNRRNHRKHGVWFEEAESIVRIISARKADKQEQGAYWG